MTDKCCTCINYDPEPRKERCIAKVWHRMDTGFLTTDENIEKLINESSVCVYYFEKEDYEIISKETKEA